MEVKSIDSLGRIVIPSGIRKTLNIFDDTLLGIDVVDNKIILSKIDTVGRKNNELLIKILKSLISSDVIVTDMNKVVSSTREEIINKELAKSFITTLHNRQKQHVNDVKIIEKFDFSGEILMYPILKNSVLYGSIVIFLKNIDIFNKNVEILDLIVKLYLENYA